MRAPALILGAVLIVTGALPGRAAVFTVDASVDDVDATPGDGFCLTASLTCTLRAAIQESNTVGGANTIMLPAGTYTLTVAGTNEEDAASGDLDITGQSFDTLSIQGAGAAATIVDGGGIDRVFHVCPTGFDCVAKTVDIADVTIRNGDAGTDSGGGIRNRGILRLTRTVVTGNTASAGTCGGGIDNVDTGTLTLTDSVLSGNVAAGISGGGGLCNHAGSLARLVGTTISGNMATGSSALGGGILSMQVADVTLTNCTVSGNSSDGAGAGIFNYGGYGFTRTTLNNVTVTGNTAGTMDITGAGGGGVATVYSFGYIFLRNTILAGNTDLAGTAPDCGGQLDSAGYNLIESTTGCSFTSPDATNVTGVDPSLGPLQDNGGPTPTRALLPGSAAINAGNPTGCEDWDRGVLAGPVTDDQRHVARAQGTACDVGAYEAVVCGDSTTGPGEQCDDGNLVNGDCCTSTCLNEAPHPCSDSDACTAGDACAFGACVPGLPVTCDPCEICDHAIGCTLPVAPGCQSSAGALSLKSNADPAKEKLSWKWVSAAQVDKIDYGTPLTGTSLTLCLIDQRNAGPTLELSATVPPGGLCGGVACWRESATKLDYADKAASQHGIQKVQLKAGAAGKARIAVKGGGVHLGAPGVPLTIPVTARLIRSDGPQCWEATFTSPSRNEMGQFKAKQ